MLSFYFNDLFWQVAKNVFVIFYSGERAKSKILKICEAFGANRYPFTEDVGKQMQLIDEVCARHLVAFASFFGMISRLCLQLLNILFIIVLSRIMLMTQPVFSGNLTNLLLPSAICNCIIFSIAM